VLPSAADDKPVPLLTTPFAERGPQISPDGKWLAYSSDETGTLEVYVRSFPRGDGKWQVSTDGGVDVRWRGDSKELFYASRLQLGSLMAVDVNAAGSTLSIGTPHKLFDLTLFSFMHPGVPGTPRFAVSRNGQRFLMPTSPRATTFSDPTSAPIGVLNWAAGLQK
jgi:hypothetical protein